jgi:hypothetical protein
MIRSAAALAFLLCAALPAQAAGEDAARAAELLLGTAGTWTGALTYSDYQTGEETSLKLTQTVTLLPDGATLQTVSAYDDGPAGIVYIVSLQGLGADGAHWQTAAFRKGDGMETGTAQLILPAAPTDATHWTVVTLEDGTDGDSPAVIRHTITRDGDRLTELSEYDRKDDAAEVFTFRNRTELTRQP